MTYSCYKLSAKKPAPNFKSLDFVFYSGNERQTRRQNNNWFEKKDGIHFPFYPIFFRILKAALKSAWGCPSFFLSIQVRLYHQLQSFNLQRLPFSRWKQRSFVGDFSLTKFEYADWKQPKSVLHLVLKSNMNFKKLFEKYLSFTEKIKKNAFHFDIYNFEDYSSGDLYGR